MDGFLENGIKEACYGCEACIQVCGTRALSMSEDAEGFSYPVLDKDLCVECGVCYRVCPYSHRPARNGDPVVVFGGHHRDAAILENSTSGGAFSALAAAWFSLPGETVLFGAACDGLSVYHKAAFSVDEAAAFRKSKYVQSTIGTSYADVRTYLRKGFHVLFSGTPCQIAGLKAFLAQENTSRLLTVEVVCEGIPSPLYIRSFDAALHQRYGASISRIDYRCKDGNRWDFQVMDITLANGKNIKLDRWFNPFWDIWLSHLMSRPSCYHCAFAAENRVADITLGDLWGVHIYCPGLYANNAGASLVLCNTDMGASVLGDALPYLQGRELLLSDALKYQSPLRHAIAENPHRQAFITDLQTMPFDQLNKKWARRSSLTLLWQKYFWGNRQKVALWNLRQSIAYLWHEMKGV